MREGGADEQDGQQKRRYPPGPHKKASAMQRMSALDASFLEIEDAVSHMHIGSVAIFEGPPPRYDELRGMVLGKLALVPRYRQIVRFVALKAGRPLWIVDPHRSEEPRVGEEW